MAATNAAIAIAGTANGHLAKVHQWRVAAKTALYRLDRIQMGQCILKAASAVSQSVLSVILLRV